MVREAIDLVSYQFGVAEITLDAQIDADLPRVMGDPARLEQVFVNLLSNAIHAVRQVPPPRTITLASGRDAAGVWLKLEDNGPGIPTTLRHRLFRPFVTTKGRQGTGLGLYISRQILRDAGGDIEVEPSRRRRGAVPGPAPGGAGDGLARSPLATRPGPRRPPRWTGSGSWWWTTRTPLRRPIARFLRRRGRRGAGGGRRARGAGTGCARRKGGWTSCLPTCGCPGWTA